MKNCKLNQIVFGRPSFLSLIFWFIMFFFIPTEDSMGNQAGLKTQTVARAGQDKKSLSNISDSPFDVIMEKLKISQNKARFIPPSPQDLDLARQLFTGIFQGKSPAALAPTLTRLDLIMETIGPAGPRFHLLMEAPTHRQGRGFYIFPANPAESVFSDQVFMVPHGLYDYHTGDIGIRLMLEGRFAGGAFNTVHRYGSQKFEGAASNEIWDMADLSDTFFSAFTQAFVKARPGGHLIQVHGFSRKKRKTGTGKSSDIIISNGTAYPSQDLAALGHCMKINLPGMTRLYPVEINELGGTQNTIGKLMRSMGHPGFIHLEMSLSMRKEMTRDHGIRNCFLTCIKKL